MKNSKKCLDVVRSFVECMGAIPEQCDLILLLFDANKTDIGDEMQEAMAALKGNEDKVRVVLNKSDVRQIKSPEPPFATSEGSNVKIDLVKLGVLNGQKTRK